MVVAAADMAVVTTILSSRPAPGLTTPVAVTEVVNAASAGNPASSYGVASWFLATAARPFRWGCGLGWGGRERPGEEVCSARADHGQEPVQPARYARAAGVGAAAAVRAVRTAG